MSGSGEAALAALKQPGGEILQLGELAWVGKCCLRFMDVRDWLYETL